MTPSGTPAAGITKADAAPRPHGGDSAPILVVDDNPVNRHLLVALLQRGGFSTVSTADDGIEALQRMESVQPDLILLDLMMPRMDGFEFCRRLRAEPRWRDVPVLVQSSLNRAEDRAQAFEAGATDYVTKPVNGQELIARVRVHLRNRALLRDLLAFRRRTERELTLARTMQKRLMPSAGRIAEAEATRGVRVAARFVPSSELGGDFWDLRPAADGRLLVYMVDFSGHGVGAALNTFRLHAIVQRMDLASLEPPAFLEALNRRLCSLLPSGQFATMLAGIIDPETDLFTYASAGSTRPMAWGPGDTAPHLGESAGLPLGLLAGATYECRSLPFPPGGRIFLYSDAAIEIPHGDDVLDDTGLAALLAPRLDAPPDRRLLDDLNDTLCALGPVDDDLTLLLLSRPPA